MSLSTQGWSTLYAPILGLLSGELVMNVSTSPRLIVMPAIIALAWIWLWPFRPLPLNGFAQEILAFSAALIVLTLSLLQVQTIRVAKYVVLFLGLSAIPVLQSWLGLIPFSGNAWLVSAYLFAFSMMLIAGHSMTLNRASISKGRAEYFIEILAAVFVLASALSTWIALRQYFHLADSIWEVNHNSGRPYANLGQPNNLATLLGLGLAGCLYFYEKQLLGIVAAGVLTFFLLLGLAVTQSRTPWVTSLAILAFWLIKMGDFAPRLRFPSLRSEE